MKLMIALAFLCGSLISVGSTAPAFAQAAAAPIPSELVFVPVVPCRAFETSLAQGTNTNFVVAGAVGFPSQGGKQGGCGVLDSATAITVALTASNAAGAGTLTAYAAGTTMPGPVTSLSFGTSQSATATSIVAVRSKRIALAAIGHSAHVTGDITGYYIPQIQAEINGDGSIGTGTSRVLSVEHVGTGFYYITVDRNVRQCSVQATTYNLHHYASVGLSASSTPQKVSVFTWRLDSTSHAETAEDYAFFFHISC